MSRSFGVWTAALAIGCSGGDGDGDGAVTFEQVLGLENQDVHLLTRTPDGLVFLRGMPNAQLMRAVGTQVSAISKPGTNGVLRVAAARDGTVYLTENSNDLYRVDGASAVLDATLPTTANEVFVDGTGGVYVSQGSGLAYRPAGGSTFAPVDMAPLTLLSLVPPGTRSTDGSIYAYNAAGANEAGLVKLPAGGGAASRVIDCQIPELSFCNAELTLVRDGDAEPIGLVANVFQDSGGELYRIQGSTLTRFASPPPQHTFVIGMARPPGSDDLYVSSAFDNLASSAAYLYRLRGSEWQNLGIMPGRGVIAFGGDGTFYAAITVVGGVGGLWTADL